MPGFPVTEQLKQQMFQAILSHQGLPIPPSLRASSKSFFTGETEEANDIDH